MLTYIGQAILHTVIAATFVEALLRVWRLEDSGTRLGYRLLSLVLPLVTLPLFWLVAPFRWAPWFSERWALLSTERWAQVRVGGVGIDLVALAVLALMGTALFLLDFLRALRTWIVDRSLPPASGDAAGVDYARVEVGRLAHRLRMRPPSVRFVESDTPVLLCSGLIRMQLVVSTRALRTLDGRQARAALAHELIHAQYRDPLLGWFLMAIRIALFFSPATQLVARASVGEMERRADDGSVALTGDRLDMARALVRLFTAQQPVPARTASGPARLGAWLRIGRTASIERRCHRLLSPRHPRQPFPLEGPRWVVAGISLAVLLFFVV
ncbi:MAG: M56 family metallopeptidase [Acidobacteria bacterium]|nr:M56 family metallopeptidase [Acidobacteriota bacterium]